MLLSFYGKKVAENGFLENSLAESDIPPPVPGQKKPARLKNFIGMKYTRINAVQHISEGIDTLLAGSSKSLIWSETDRLHSSTTALKSSSLSSPHNTR